MKKTHHSEYLRLETLYLKSAESSFYSEKQLSNQWEELQFISKPNFNESLKEYEKFQLFLANKNIELKGFLDRNTIPEEAVLSSKLLLEMLKDRAVEIIEKDVNGDFHFNGNFKNATDVIEALEKLSETKYSALLASDTPKILQAFEDVFNHKAFTGRSGTFYGY